jgi:hypothetical protein
VRDPRTSLAPRLGLSLAAAALTIGALMFALGVADHASRLRDEQAFAGVLVAIASWLLLLYPIWASYTRWRRLLRTILACILVLVAAIGSSAFFGMTLRNPEFFIAGSLFSGAALCVAIIAASLHQAMRGRPMLAPDGAIEVRCPACGYSMAGLDACTCPECGHRSTLDALIRAQDYEALRALPAAEAAARTLPAAGAETGPSANSPVPGAA